MRVRIYFLNLFLVFCFRMSRHRRRLHQFRCEIKAGAMERHRYQGFVEEVAPKVYDPLQQKGHHPPLSPFRDGFTNRVQKVSCSGKNDGSSLPTSACSITKVCKNIVNLRYTFFWVESD